MHSIDFQRFIQIGIELPYEEWQYLIMSGRNYPGDQ
jgi:hypothetical protein